MGEPEGGGGGEGEGGFLGGFEHLVEQGSEWASKGSTLTDIIGGGATAIKGAEAFSHIAPFGGTMFDAFTNGAEAVSGGESMLGGFGKALGPIGMGLSAASAIGNGVQLANDISSEGFSNAYHDSKAYNHAGGMALGAAHTILPMLGPYGEAANLALTGGELLANGAGAASGWAFGDKAKFNADSVAGGLIRGTFGDQSMGEQVRQGVGSVFGHGGVANAVGWGADIATNAAMLPVNLGMTVGRGAVDFGKTVFNSIASGEGAVGGALNHAGHWIGDTASTVGHGIANGATSAWNWGSNAVSNIGHGIGNVASTVGSGISSAASTVGHGISNVASSIGSGVSNAASSVGNAASSAFHAVTSW
jgi:hypothetical protein